MRKKVEELLSGEIVVTEKGWDRVHGVSDAKDGKVTVNSDANSSGIYPVGTIVTTV